MGGWVWVMMEGRGERSEWNGWGVWGERVVRDVREERDVKVGGAGAGVTRVLSYQLTSAHYPTNPPSPPKENQPILTHQPTCVSFNSSKLPTTIGSFSSGLNDKSSSSKFPSL